MERNQTGLLELSPATPMKNQPLISDTWPGNRRCYFDWQTGSANRLFSQRLGNSAIREPGAKSCHMRTLKHCLVTFFWYITLSSSGFGLCLHLCPVKLNYLFSEHLQVICCMSGVISKSFVNQFILI